MTLLNEEYSNQLLHYQKEKEEKENEFNEKLTKLKNENENIRIDYTPEMIPPEETFKIFLHFIKHLQYEGGMYKKYISKGDIKNIKQFLQKVDVESEKVKVLFI
jgi:hypothetical protein